jgi:hypothetical protein
MIYGFSAVTKKMGAYLKAVPIKSRCFCGGADIKKRGW